MFGAIKSAMGMKPKPVMGQPPQMGGGLGGMKQGLGPSNPLMSKMAQNVGSIGGMMGGRDMTRPPQQMGPPPGYRAAGEAAGNDMSWMDQPGAVQTGPPPTPDVMPPSGNEEAIGRVGQAVGGMMGLGPRPQMMPRRPMMRPQMMGGRGRM